MRRPAWYPDWTGETCIIVASGPSASGVDLEPARGKVKCIAVNSSWKLAPWADALYACDFKWWEENNGCPEFKGLKMSISPRARNADWGIRYVKCLRGDDRINLGPAGTIGWGGNSGFGALNLAAHFGATKIILVGYDMNIKAGTHWHGDHPLPLSNPKLSTIGRWRRAIDAGAKVLAANSIKVINCSAISSLTAYPKMTLTEALDA
ncbi:hypothetical protein [Mesorhizobium sp. CAU 1741]|uniref:hypothetical protein n=1 Tax=Mesorhizobium sp. CAU 1741 TaxID=3140366 RepID=UPI00325AF8C3